MGFFNRNKKTYVTSVAYPLGEDDGQHTPYLQYTMLNALLQGRPIAESITQGYLRGQGVSLRNAFRYARDHYTDGVPESNVGYAAPPDEEEIRPILEALNPGSDITFHSIKVSTADFFWWGDQYLADTYGYDPFEGNFASPPVDVDVDATVSYDMTNDGDIVILMVNADTSTYSETITPVDLVLLKNYVHVAYETLTTTVDGPDTSTRPAEVGEVDHTDTDVVEIDAYTTETTVTETTISGATATDVVTVTTEVRSRPKFWMYQIGLGTYPVLDSWLADENLESPYYPSIPVRVNNVDFTDDAHQDTDLYKTGKRMLRRVGIDIDDIAESVNDNEDIDDIDYCYVVFGVSLNAGSQECKRYLYRFFEHLYTISTVDQTTFDAWSPASKITGPNNVLKIFSTENRDRHHDIELQWNYINQTLEVGTVFPGAKPGDVFVGMAGDQSVIDISFNNTVELSILMVRRQVDADTYTQFEISGLTFENFVYKGKSVHISAFEALTDEDEEGFIIPLNYQIIRNTPMVELTDLSYQCNHLVFNCYKIVKEKWYQTGLFKIVMIIIAIIIIVVTWGTGTPAAASMLAAVFVGAGISVTMAIVLAATIYVLGMMILMNIIAKVSIGLFGEKWGAVIAVIVSFIAMNWSNIASMAGTVATNGLSTIITAQNLLQATTLLANAYGAYAMGQMTEIQKKAMGLWTEYDEQMKHIEELSRANLNSNLDMIDIQGYTDSTFTQLFESYDSFITRTLLTGSDICNITAGLVENFSDVGLQLPTS